VYVGRAVLLGSRTVRTVWSHAYLFTWVCR